MKIIDSMVDTYCWSRSRIPEKKKKRGGHEMERVETHTRRARHGCAALLDARPRDKPGPQAQHPFSAGRGLPDHRPSSPLSFSIPAQTARAHGILAQRASCHGGPRILVRF